MCGGGAADAAGERKRERRKPVAGEQARFAHRPRAVEHTVHPGKRRADSHGGPAREELELGDLGLQANEALVLAWSARSGAAGKAGKARGGRGGAERERRGAERGAAEDECGG